MPRHAGARVLCDEALRTMSGGEPSSIKQTTLCAAANLRVRMTGHSCLVVLFDLGFAYKGEI
jgi:hypothetical protein